MHAPHHHAGAQAQCPHGRAAALRAAALAAAGLQDAGEPLLSDALQGSRNAPQTNPFLLILVIC